MLTLSLEFSDNLSSFNDESSDSKSSSLSEASDGLSVGSSDEEASSSFYCDSLNNSSLVSPADDSSGLS